MDQVYRCTYPNCGNTVEQDEVRSSGQDSLAGTVKQVELKITPICVHNDAPYAMLLVTR